LLYQHIFTITLQHQNIILMLFQYILSINMT